MADSEEIKKKGGLSEAFPGEEIKDSDDEEALKKQYEIEEFKGKKNKLKEKPEKKTKSRVEKFDDGEDLEEDFSGKKDLNDSDDDDDDDDDQDDDEEESDELDEGIIDRAIDAGMDPEDIEEYSTNEKLLKHVRILERAEKRKSRNDADDDDSPSKRHSDEDKKPSSKKKEGDDEPDFKIDLDPDLYDPKTIETLKNLNKHYHGKVSELMGTITQLKERLDVSDERENVKIRRQTMDEFDSQIANLLKDEDDGEFWKETFGETDHLKINKKSKAFKNRAEVWTEMKALAKADNELGRSSDLKTLFKKALNSVYSDKLDTKAKFSLSKKVKSSKRTFISRPNQKGSSEKRRGKDAAVDFADNFLKNLS
jgi:hypothetical protein